MTRELLDLPPETLSRIFELFLEDCEDCRLKDSCYCKRGACPSLQRLALVCKELYEVSKDMHEHVLVIRIRDLRIEGETQDREAGYDASIGDGSDWPDVTDVHREHTRDLALSLGMDARCQLVNARRGLCEHGHFSGAVPTAQDGTFASERAKRDWDRIATLADNLLTFRWVRSLTLCAHQEYDRHACIVDTLLDSLSGAARFAKNLEHFGLLVNERPGDSTLRSFLACCDNLRTLHLQFPEHEAPWDRFSTTVQDASSLPKLTFASVSDLGCPKQFFSRAPPLLRAQSICTCFACRGIRTDSSVAFGSKRLSVHMHPGVMMEEEQDDYSTCIDVAPLSFELGELDMVVFRSTARWTDMSLIGQLPYLQRIRIGTLYEKQTAQDLLDDISRWNRYGDELRLEVYRGAKWNDVSMTMLEDLCKDKDVQLKWIEAPLIEHSPNLSLNSSELEWEETMHRPFATEQEEVDAWKRIVHMYEAQPKYYEQRSL